MKKSNVFLESKLYENPLYQSSKPLSKSRMSAFKQSTFFSGTKSFCKILNNQPMVSLIIVTRKEI